MAFLHLTEKLDVTFEILIYCDIVALLHLRASCHRLRDIVDTFIPAHFNIEKELALYFLHPSEFRQIQYQTHTLISGSTALQAFMQTRWHSSDLDLYVFKHKAALMCEWITAQGYSYINASCWESHSTWMDALADTKEDTKRPYVASIHKVLIFERIFRDTTRTVQIIVAARSPLACILSFHSSMYFVNVCDLD